MQKAFTAALLYFAHQAEAKTKEEWKKRSVYQLLTDRYYRSNGNETICTDLSQYCGGDFLGIQEKLDYIQGMGFDAIWISPIPHNAPPDYHGYGALNWEQVNEHFGTE
jgi:alpha-amylase